MFKTSISLLIKHIYLLIETSICITIFVLTTNNCS